MKAENLHKAVFASQFMFPNLKVLLTMPVSEATAERSFSGLRRLKTYLCNMSETRLSGLTLLHIHHDSKIDIPEIACEFDASSTQRIAFLHTPDT